MVIDVGIVAQWIVALGAIGGVLLAAYKLVKKFTELVTELRTFRASQEKTNTEVKGEMCVIVDCFAAVFDGLEQQGCNGAVTDAKNKLAERLNKQAHQ